MIRPLRDGAPRIRRFTWSRPAWSLIGLLIAYYAFPVETSGSSSAVIALSLVITAGGLGLLVWMMIKELNHVRHGQELLGAQTLAMLLVLVVMSASMAFFLIDLVDATQISGLHTKTDALYFTLTTMATVGYGDVHAAGQLARAIVSCLIVFNVVVIAALVRANTTRPRK